MRVAESVDLPAPPEEVWNVVMDPSRLGDWVSIHRSADTPSAGLLDMGSSFCQTLALGGRPFDVRWTVTGLARPREAVWQGSGPVGSRASVHYGLERRNGGTRFSYENEFKLPGGPLGAFAGRIVGRRAFEREAKRSLANLRELFKRSR